MFFKKIQFKIISLFSHRLFQFQKGIALALPFPVYCSPPFGSSIFSIYQTVFHGWNSSPMGKKKTNTTNVSSHVSKHPVIHINQQHTWCSTEQRSNGKVTWNLAKRPQSYWGYKENCVNCFSQSLSVKNLFFLVQKTVVLGDWKSPNKRTKGNIYCRDL